MFKKELDNSLKTNITFIDEEHASLVQISDELITAVENSAHNDRLIELLDFMERYARTHFTNEEQFMREKEYSSLEEHASKHADFISTLDKAKNKLNTSKENADQSKFAAELKKQIIDHITEYDLKMIKSINS